MKTTFVLATFALALIATAGAQGKDKKEKPAYKVGTFSATTSVSDGRFSNANCTSTFGCFGSTKDASHNVHLIITPEGRYKVQAPVDVTASLLIISGPTVYKPWFMDNLHEGDTVLFIAECNKHNECRMRFPNPDKPDKEIATQGKFDPSTAKTNATVLCGSGKLTPEVEAQVCPIPVANATPAAKD